MCTCLQPYTCIAPRTAPRTAPQGEAYTRASESLASSVESRVHAGTGGREVARCPEYGVVSTCTRGCKHSIPAAALRARHPGVVSARCTADTGGLKVHALQVRALRVPPLACASMASSFTYYLLLTTYYLLLLTTYYLLLTTLLLTTHSYYFTTYYFTTVP